MQQTNQSVTHRRTKSVPIYPVILFVVAFLYLIGVMTWQVWKDHDYHQALTTKMVKSRVNLYLDYFNGQMHPLERLMAHYASQSFDETVVLERFYLKAAQTVSFLNSVALVTLSGALTQEVGAPLSQAAGAEVNTRISFDHSTPNSGLNMLDEHNAIIYQRLKRGGGYLVAVIDMSWFKALLARNDNPHAVYEVLDLSSNKRLWLDVLLNLASTEKNQVTSVLLSGSSLELNGYIHSARIEAYYRSSMTPSILVAFFYLFGGIGLIVYLGSARRQNDTLLQKNRELAFRGDLILSSISDSVVVMDKQGEVLFANASFYAMLGLPQSKNINEVVKHGNHGVFWQQLERWTQALLSEQTDHAESILTLDGSSVSRQFEPTHQMLSLEDGSQVVVWILKDVTEQHRIHQQLITSQSHYQSTFEGAGVALAMIDLNEMGRLLSSDAVTSSEGFVVWREQNDWQFKSLVEGMLITEVNASACQLFDCIDEMTLAKHLKKHLFDTESLIWDELVRLVLSSTVDKSRDSHHRLIELSSVSGRIINVQISLSWVKPLAHDTEGVLGDVLLSLLDVTDLKEAKEVAVEREQFWQKVIHSVPDVVYVNDFSTHQSVFVNHDLGKRLGYTKAQIAELGDRYWQKLLHPEDRMLLKAELPKLRQFENGAVKETVLRLKDSAGKWHHFLFRDTPFTRDEENQVKRYIGVARDITELLEARTRVDKHERYLEVLAENIRDLVWVMDPEFHFKYISPSIVQVLGYQQEDMINKSVRAFLAEDQFARIEKEIAEPLRAIMQGELNAENYRNETGEHVVEVMALHQDGHYVSLEVKIGLLWDEDNNFEGLLGSCRDVTSRRKGQAELKLAAEVFESSNEAILITDMDGDIVRTNRAFKTVTGYQDEVIVGQNLSSLCTEQQTEQFYHTLLDGVSRSGYWQGEVWHRKQNGEPFPAWVGVSSVTNEDGFVESFIIIFSDMSERKEAEERIHRLAYYDPLTDLANRSLFMEQLRLEMRHADDNQGAVALLYLDLDNFKPVNDTMGHEAGDTLLKQVAQRLQSCVRSSDTVARMGGDEFTIILGGQSSESDARAFGELIAGQVVSTLQAPIEIQGKDFFVTASVGVALYPKHASDVSALLRHADHAMYRAKEAGRNLYHVHSE